MAKDGLTKINDKDIAKELNMSPEQFSQMKNNNRIPFEKLVLLCMKNNVNINWILDTSRFPEHQVESTFQIYKWFKCRKYKYIKLLNSVSTECEKIKEEITYYSIENNSDNKKIDYKKIEYISPIFNQKYKTQSRFTKKLILLIWAIIIFFIGYYIGVNKT